MLNPHGKQSHEAGVHPHGLGVHVDVKDDVLRQLDARELLRDEVFHTGGPLEVVWEGQDSVAGPGVIGEVVALCWAVSGSDPPGEAGWAAQWAQQYDRMARHTVREQMMRMGPGRGGSNRPGGMEYGWGVAYETFMCLIACTTHLHFTHISQLEGPASHGRFLSFLTHESGCVYVCMCAYVNPP